MAVCKSKLKEGSQAPHCTFQLLWLRQPWSFDRCQNKPLPLAALGKLPLRQPRGPLRSQEASCTGHVFTLLSLKQSPNTSAIPNTPLTAIQHSLLQRNETCGTRLLISPVHWLSPWPHHQHMQKSSDRVRVSVLGGTQIPSGMIQMGVLVWHLHMAPEVEENLFQFQNTTTLSSPFLFHIPHAGHPSCGEGTTTTLQKGKSSSTEGEKYSQKQQFGEQTLLPAAAC